jgi:hypothetical protein
METEQTDIRGKIQELQRLDLGGCMMRMHTPAFKQKQGKSMDIADND